jgi:hypothetical protein
LIPRLTLAAALVAAAPFPALAQTRPAAVVSGATRLAVTSPPAAFTLQRDVWIRAPEGVPPTQPARLPQARGATPVVEIPAKPEWRDDQGLRLSLNRLSYRQRF